MTVSKRVLATFLALSVVVVAALIFKSRQQTLELEAKYHLAVIDAARLAAQRDAALYVLDAVLPVGDERFDALRRVPKPPKPPRPLGPAPAAIVDFSRRIPWQPPPVTIQKADAEAVEDLVRTLLGRPNRQN